MRGVNGFVADSCYDGNAVVFDTLIFIQSESIGRGTTISLFIVHVFQLFYFRVVHRHRIGCCSVTCFGLLHVALSEVQSHSRDRRKRGSENAGTPPPLPRYPPAYRSVTHIP